MNHQELLTSRMQWRYSPKSFLADKKIPAPDWAALEKSLLLTPSSYGLQPWKFFVITSDPLRETLKASSWNQRQVTECSHYVVFAHRMELDEAYVDKYLESVVEARGVSLESLAGLKKGICGDVLHGPRSKYIPEWSMRQVYIALGNLMTSAAILGIDTCPMEGFEAAKYDEILGLNHTPYRSTVACALGYRHHDDRLAKMAKVRFPARDLIVNL